MQGTSHTGFALAGAMSINSAVYAFYPQPLHNQWDGLVHALGEPYTYHTFVLFWQHPSVLLSAESLWSFFYKLTFYFMLIASTMWPDRWERRSLPDGTYETRFAPHRGPTHSLAMIALLVSLVAFVYEFSMTYIQTYHVVVSDVLIRVLVVLAVGLIQAFVLHILADMLTRDGVKILWPANANIGIPPIRALRPLTGSPGEYAWLWLILFVTGILFGLGIVGM